jgi:hypothetical protein
VNRDNDPQAQVVTEVIGWLMFVLFVGIVWKVRQSLDRTESAR